MRILFGAQLDLPGSELAVQGRRPDERILGKFEPHGAQDERLRLPATEATMRTD